MRMQSKPSRNITILTALMLVIFPFTGVKAQSKNNALDLLFKNQMRLLLMQTIKSPLNNDRYRDILFKNQMRLFEMQSVKSPLNNDRYRDLLFKNQMRLADMQMKMMDMRMRLMDRQMRESLVNNNRYGDFLFKNQIRQMDMQRQMMERQSRLMELPQLTTNKNPVSPSTIEKSSFTKHGSLKNSTVDMPSILRNYYKTVKDISPYLDAILGGFEYRYDYRWTKHVKTGLNFIKLSGALAQDYYQQRAPISLSSNTVGTGIQILVNQLLPGAGDMTKSYLSLFTRYNERGATLTVDEINGWVYGVNKMTWAIVGLMRTGGNVEAMKAYATTADITARTLGILTYSHFEKAYFFFSGTSNQLFEQNKLQNELKFRNQLYRINITPNWLFRNNMDYYWRFQRNKWIR